MPSLGFAAVKSLSMMRIEGGIDHPAVFAKGHLKMLILHLWYLFIFAWGITCAWAMIKGLG